MKVIGIMFSLALGFTIAVIEESMAREENLAQLVFNSPDDLKRDLLNLYLTTQEDEMIELSSDL